MSLKDFERVVWTKGNKRVNDAKVMHETALLRLAIGTSDVINMIGGTQIKDYKPVSAKDLLDRWQNKTLSIKELKARMKAADDRSEARLKRERRRG